MKATSIFTLFLFILCLLAACYPQKECALISNNPNLSNVLRLDPHRVDTIIHNNIATDEPLKYMFGYDIM